MDVPTAAERTLIVREILHADATERARNYSAYIGFYTSTFCPFAATRTAVQVDNTALRSHTQVLDALKTLCSDPKATRHHLEETLFPLNILDRDREDAIRSLVLVCLMLDCSLKDKYSRDFQIGGYLPPKWEKDESFDHFVDRALPKGLTKDHEIRMHRNSLKAWKLEKRLGIKFKSTNNITEHLLYDPAARVVRVFHQTAYLKAHLARSLETPIELDVNSSLRLYDFPSNP